jgi:hypothetical protein
MPFKTVGQDGWSSPAPRRRIMIELLSEDLLAEVSGAGVLLSDGVLLGD